MRHNFWQKILYFPVITPVIAGCLLALAFAPFNLKILAVLAPIILLQRMWNFNDIKRAAVDGWCFGIGFFGISVYWLYITLYQFAGVSLFFSILLTSLFVCLLGIYFLLVNILSAYLANGSEKKLAIAFSCSWVLFEYVRSNLFSGFAWNLLGYSQTDWLLRGYIPIFGAYGLSFIVLLIAALLWLLMKNHKSNQVLTTVIYIFVILFVAYTLQNKEWVLVDKKNKNTVALVQGNIAQNVKWNPSALFTSLNTYKDFSHEARNSNIIVWPESAIPAFRSQIAEYLQSVAADLTPGSSLVLGIPTVNINDTHEFYNSVIVLGNGYGMYNKIHLVPFGEYFPLQFITKPILHMLQIPMDSFSPGANKQNLLTVRGMRVAAYLCYDIIFPDMVLQRTKNSNLMMTLSDDSWYRDSLALDQHLQMAAFQSAASQRYQLFVSNSGITTIISDKGIIDKYLPLDKAGVLYGDIYSVSGATPIMNYGYFYLWVLISIILIYLLLIKIIEKNSSK
jgi:apolipoprotein N-acyltransferase